MVFNSLAQTNCSLNMEAQNTDMYEQTHGMNEVKR